MAITAGSNALASDFISTSSGAGDTGKVPKLNASGKLDSSFLSISDPVVRVYASGATWSKPSRLHHITVEVVGGGGGSGGVDGPASTTRQGTGGGASGGYARKL